MSLDVYLKMPNKPAVEAGSGIFVRENGETKEISRAEWDAKFPEREPFVASLDEGGDDEVFSANITHNLGAMAREAGIYEALWRPEEIGITKAAQLIPLLKDGLAKLNGDPDVFRAFNPANGWGSYETLCNFTASYLKACISFPDADVNVWR